MLSLTLENIYAGDIHSGGEKWEGNMQKPFGSLVKLSVFMALYTLFCIFQFLYNNMVYFLKITAFLIHILWNSTI